VGEKKQWEDGVSSVRIFKSPGIVRRLEAVARRGLLFAATAISFVGFLDCARAETAPSKPALSVPITDIVDFLAEEIAPFEIGSSPKRRWMIREESPNIAVARLDKLADEGAQKLSEWVGNLKDNEASEVGYTLGMWNSGDVINGLLGALDGSIPTTFPDSKPSPPSWILLTGVLARHKNFSALLSDNKVDQFPADSSNWWSASGCASSIILALKPEFMPRRIDGSLREDKSEGVVAIEISSYYTMKRNAIDQMRLYPLSRNATLRKFNVPSLISSNMAVSAVRFRLGYIMRGKVSFDSPITSSLYLGSNQFPGDTDPQKIGKSLVDVIESCEKYTLR